MLQSARKSTPSKKKKIVEAPGDGFPRFATLFNSGGQTVSVRTQGRTGNKPFSPEGSRSIGQNGLPGLGTCIKSNLLKLIESDETVNIVQHVVVLNSQGTGEQVMQSQPSPDDMVVKLLLTRTHDDEPDGDVITGY